MATEIKIPLDEYLDVIEPEDLEEAIYILKKRWNSWQDWLASPAGMR